MSMTDRPHGSSNVQQRVPTEVRGQAVHRTDRRMWDETKPSFLTTELWLTVAGLAALVIIYLNKADTSDDFTLWRACLLGTIGVSAYVVSRGMAKAASHHDHDDDGR